MIVLVIRVLQIVPEFGGTPQALVPAIPDMGDHVFLERGALPEGFPAF